MSLANLMDLNKQFMYEFAEENPNPDNPEKTDPEQKEEPADKQTDKQDPPSSEKQTDEKKEPPQEEKKEDKPEEKPEEKKKDDEKDEPEKKDNSDDVADLKAQLEKLQNELEQAKASGDKSAELAQANTLLETQKSLVTEYEGILNSMIEAKMADVPDSLKELVPANLSIKDRMDWITKAENAGLFKPQGSQPFEIGKPMNPNSTKQPTDPSKLSASSLMAMAYGSSTTGKGKK